MANGIYQGFARDYKVCNVQRKVVWFQWLINKDVMSYDQAENRPDQALK